MADLSEPGPSNVKKRKIIHVKKPKKLSDEEILEFLCDSDRESLQDENNSDDDCKLHKYYNIEGFNLYYYAF